MRHVWRVVVPQEGYTHHFVMQGILALASLHKAYLIPSQRQLYLDLSAHHKSQGLRVFRGLLDEVTATNWKSIFCFASLVIAFVCALPARSDNRRMPTPIFSTLELFSLIRGIRSILSPWVSEIHKTALAPLTQGVWNAQASHSATSVVQRITFSLLNCNLANLMMAF
jgi:hypothetical protein